MLKKFSVLRLLFFFRKLQIHNDVISPKALYSVRCVEGGTRQYIEALSKTFKEKIVLNSQIEEVKRCNNSIDIIMRDGSQERFDRIVFACHADQALELLSDPSPLEEKLLGLWDYKEGKVVVHRDHSYFPARDLIQAYTFLYRDENGIIKTSVNGALWFEPQVSDDCDYISTQHPNFPIRKELIEFETTLRTPIFNFNSVSHIKEMPLLNGKNQTYFCGSHFGYGLHNDAVSSAMEVAKALGVQVPSPGGPLTVKEGLRELFSFGSKNNVFNEEEG